MSSIDRRRRRPISLLLPFSLSLKNKPKSPSFTCSPSIWARRASTCAMSSSPKKRTGKRENESANRRRKVEGARASQLLSSYASVWPSSFLRETEAKKKTRTQLFQLQPLLLLFLSPFRTFLNPNDDLPPLVRGRARRPRDRGRVVVVSIARGDCPPLRRSRSVVDVDDDAGARLVVVAPLAQVPGSSRRGREPSGFRRLR